MQFTDAVAPERFARRRKRTEGGPAGPVPLAFVMASFEPGGTERQMIELLRRLDPGRWTVHLACFRACGSWFERAAEAAVSVAQFPLRSLRRPSVAGRAWAFAEWCRARQIAIVQTTELYSNIFALPAAAAARVPVRIASRRELNPDKTKAQIAMQRAAYAFAHHVVANSTAAASRLEIERVPRRKISIVPNGLDLRLFKPRAATGRMRQVIVVANLRPEKGHDVLVEAAANVLLRFPDARFDIVGDGPERRRLTERTRALGIEHAFTFHGHREDVPACLAAADLFVLPSRSEACPNAVLEAMAAGLPIVASGVGGILELVVDDRTGLLVAPDDPPALCRRICELMAHPARASQLGAAARAEASACYSFDRMVDAFDRLYLRALAARGVLAGAQPQLAAS